MHQIIDSLTTGISKNVTAEDIMHFMQAAMKCGYDSKGQRVLGYEMQGVFIVGTRYGKDIENDKMCFVEIAFRHVNWQGSTEPNILYWYTYRSINRGCSNSGISKELCSRENIIFQDWNYNGR